MTKLIDAEALSEKLCETTIFIKDGEVFQHMINDAPTIEPDGDLISRQDAIDAFAKWRIKCALYPSDEICNILKSLPSAEPKTGECRTCKRNADNGGVYEDGRR